MHTDRSNYEQIENGEEEKQVDEEAEEAMYVERVDKSLFINVQVVWTCINLSRVSMFT